MNVRKCLLLSIVVLLVCQLGFAQVVTNKTLAKQSFAKAQATGKPTPSLRMKSLPVDDESRVSTPITRIWDRGPCVWS